MKLTIENQRDAIKNLQENKKINEIQHSDVSTSTDDHFFNELHHNPVRLSLYYMLYMLLCL